MGRDSNPRYPYEYGSFQDCCLKPLGHPSGSEKIGYSAVLLSAFPYFTPFIHPLCWSKQKMHPRSANCGECDTPPYTCKRKGVQWPILSQNPNPTNPARIFLYSATR